MRFRFCWNDRLCEFVLLGVLGMSIVVGSGQDVLADDAVILPKGTFRLFADGLFNLPIKNRFTKNGDTEPLGIDLSGELNSVAFPDLALVEQGFALPAGSASFGESKVTYKLHIQEYLFQLGYGLTDRLSIGINIPYFVQKNKVKASLNNSTSTVGFNSGVPGGVAPLAVPGTATPTADDIQDLLVSRGFKRVKTWEDSGIGDIEVGGKYQYYQSESIRLAVTGGVRFPTGRVDDPDNLADRGHGNGAYAILLRLHQDWVYQTESGLAKRLGLPSFGSFFVNTTFKYAAVLPDKQELRVCDVHTPLCEAKDTVKRNLGDVVQAEITGSVGLPFKGAFISGLYSFTHGFKDHYSGKDNLPYDLLEQESNFTKQDYRVALTYTTIPLVLENKFPLPLIVSVYFRDRIAADNNVFDVRSIGFQLAAYF